MSYLNNSHRKFVASVLTAALVVTAVTPASAATYSDVSDRYKEAVDFLAAEKITEGLTSISFGTGKAIKRADAAVLLAKALGLDGEDAKDSGFTDVPDRAKKYVDALKQSGIVNGKTATSFASDQLITRGEVALMLTKAYSLEARTTMTRFMDVAPKYQAAVNALLENEVTTGKTNTSFGTNQAITRGEFAIFLHKVSIVNIPEFQMSVGNEADLINALGNADVKEVILLENITAAALPIIKRNVKIDLNGKVLTGNLEYKDYVGTGDIQLFSSAEGGKLQGDLMIDAPKSDFIIGENVEVTEKTTIINVKENTFYNNGVLQSVDIIDNDGVSFANQGNGSIAGTLAINTVGNVKLIGNLEAVEVNQAAKITVDASGTIIKLNVKASNVVLTAPEGAVVTLEASPGVIVQDATGTQIVTQPAGETIQPSLPSPRPTTPPVVVNIVELIGKYEEKQKAFIDGNFVNEERYSEYYTLTIAQEELAKQLDGKILTKEEIDYLKQIEKALDLYLVASYNPHVSIYANHVSLYSSDMGVEIDWSSSRPEVINADDGSVMRPAKGEEAIEVTLTAKITGNEETREITLPILVEAETNTYTTASSLATNEWEMYANVDGYFTSRLEVNFNLEEMAKDYNAFQKARITLRPNWPQQEIVMIENINNEAKVIFENPIRDSNYTYMESADVLIELLNEDGSTADSWMHEVRVNNMKPLILETFEKEINTLTSDSIIKYIPGVKNFTLEEISLILLNFNNLQTDQKTLEQLHASVEEVKLAQAFIK